MTIRPIRSDDDHRAALAQIDELWGAQPGTPDGDTLDVLLALVETYEDRRWPIREPDWDPVDVLHHAIDDLGHTQQQLAALLGSAPRASEILNRKRALTVEMIHKISTAWRIPAELLIKPYKLTVAA